MAAMAGLYRRLLPSPPSVDFASSHGKQLFLEGIQNGTMEGFYRLVSYFQTQSEPAFCGLASLSMVLNALAIDPGRKWKGMYVSFPRQKLMYLVQIFRNASITLNSVILSSHYRCWCVGVLVVSDVFVTIHNMFCFGLI
jgi:hypothetical protein